MRHAVLFVLLVAGCYHPSIPDDSFVCGPGGLCPEGFTCSAESLCEKNGKHVGDGGTESGLYSGLLGAIDLTNMSGMLLCSTKTGLITLKADDGTETTVVAAGALGFSRLAQVSGPLLGAWSFQALALPSTVSIMPSSDSDAMPVFAAAGAIDIEGSITWAGFGGFGGVSDGGGRSRSAGVLSGGGGGVNGGGGGGAGYATSGATAIGPGGGIGGATYGQQDLPVLHAGSGGGGGGSSPGTTAGDGGLGGNGGGAVAVLSNTMLTIGGMITVKGNPGTPGTNSAGGGGGGSGGSILLSAPTVTLMVDNTKPLTATGGAGGMGAGTGADGAMGSVGRIFVGGTLTGVAVAMPSIVNFSSPASSFPMGATAAPQ